MEPTVRNQWQEILEHFRETGKLSRTFLNRLVKSIAIANVDEEKMELSIGMYPMEVGGFKKNYSATLEKSVYEVTGKRYSLVFTEPVAGVMYPEELYREMEQFLSQECKEKVFYVYGPMQSEEHVSMYRMIHFILQKQGKTENVMHKTSELFVSEVIDGITRGSRSGYDCEYVGKKIVEKNLVYDFLAVEALQYIKNLSRPIDFLMEVLKARIQAGKKTMIGSDRSFAELCEIIPELARIVTIDEDVLYPRSVIV